MLDDLWAMANGKAEIEIVGAFFGEQNSENFVVDELFDQLRRLGQDFVEI